MNELELSDPNIIKILKNAFSDIDTIRVEARKDSFKIFGVDEAHVIFTDLILKKNAFSRYEITSDAGISISLSRFRRILDIASSDSLTEFKSLIMSLRGTHINFKIKGEISTIDEKIFDVPTGIREPPPLPDFAKAVSCELNVTKDFRLGFTIFNPSKTQDMPPTAVSIEISDAEGCIELRPSDPTVHTSFRLSGKTSGAGKTATSVYALDNTSKVGELESIKKLKISLIEGGNMKFSYEFDQGELNYIVSASLI